MENIEQGILNGEVIPSKFIIPYSLFLGSLLLLVFVDHFEVGFLDIGGLLFAATGVVAHVRA
jgi:hypothetical protein